MRGVAAYRAVDTVSQAWRRKICTVNMREVVNGVMYVLSTGCQWRYIPKDLPPRSTVNGYLCQWGWDGNAGRSCTGMRSTREMPMSMLEREASPTVCILDSQSVKKRVKKGASDRRAWLRCRQADQWQKAPCPG